MRRWSSFEQVATFIGALVWTHHEIIVRQEARYEVLVFLATLLAGKEGVRTWLASRSAPSISSDSPSSAPATSSSPSSTL